ncbi:MAG: DUF2905 domain-containing protein [Bacteroidia bacterium]|nr:DUF2905 domain-containing protein [Bacteroidia bacterium]MDW8133533.1 DUF2905 domain-containing protein [Bacteroidia bacterium]
MGRLLVGIGIFLLLAGAVMWLMEKGGWNWPRLPGDIIVEKPNLRIYIPLGSSLLISLLLSGILYLLSRWGHS